MEKYLFMNPADVISADNYPNCDRFIFANKKTLENLIRIVEETQSKIVIVSDSSNQLNSRGGDWMNDRTFSVIGFGTQSEKIAVQLESEGIGYGWGVKTRLLLILIDSNDTDDFVVKLCCKAKEKNSRIVFLSLNPALSFTALQPAADGILINDNAQEVLTIIRTLKHVIYKYNLLSYDINDVIHFLSTSQPETITIQEHQFPGLSFSKVGKFEFPHSEESTFRHLTFINLCQQPDESFFEEMSSVLNNYNEDFSLNSMVYDAEADCSTFAIISITSPLQ